MKSLAVKSLSVLTVALIAATGCQTETTPPTESVATSVVFDFGDATTAELKVPDMMCQYACTAKVEEILTAQEGVEEVKIDFESKRVGLAINKETFDPQAAVAALIDVQFPNTKLVSATGR